MKKVILLVVVFLLLGTGSVLAEGYDNTAGVKEMVIDIDNWSTGNLSAKVASLLSSSGDSPTDILTLRISAGTLNDTDARYIDDNITGLTTLEILSPAVFASTPAPFFRNDAVIQSITLPSVTIGGNFARNCDALHTINLPNATTFSNQSIRGNLLLTTLILPSVTTFNNNCIRNNDALLNATLPNNVSFNNDCLVNNDALTTINITGNASFNINCISGNGALTDISITGSSSFYEDCLRNNDALTTLDLPNASTFGDNCIVGNALLNRVDLDSATSFGYRNFYNNPVLTTVNLHSATTFTNQVFRDTPSLTNVYLPLLNAIGNQTFRDSGIQSVSMPRLTAMGNRTFYDSNISDVYMPMLDIIGSNIFEGVTNVVTMELGSTVPGTVAADAFTIYDPENRGAILRVPVNQVDDYDAAYAPSDDNLWYGWTLQGVVEARKASNPITGQQGIYIPYTFIIGMIAGAFGVFVIYKMKAKKI